MNAQKVRDAIDLIADAMNLNEALSMAATSLPAEQAGPLGAVSDAASLKMDEAKALLYAALDDGPQPVINTYRGQPCSAKAAPWL